MIPYGRQDISQDDCQAVLDVLKSDFLTQGPVVPAFEAAVMAATEAQHAVAANSATSCLHIACLALGLGEGDLLWTVPNTFVASANVGHLCGAKVDFVDIDPKSYCMSAAALEAKLARAKKLPKVIMPVHFAGQSADMVAISELARKHGIRIVEDASHAIGASYQGQPVGSCRYSDICVFSFHPVKIVTTAEGGIATTNDKTLATRMQLFRSHGVTRAAELMQGESDGPWYYQQVELGLNYRMTEMQAALGASQMTRLGEFVAARHERAQIYNDELAGLDLVLPWQDPAGHSSLHLYPVQCQSAPRREVFEQLRAAGIGVNVHYIPVTLQPYWQAHGFKSGDFPNAEAYYNNAISLPLYPGLSIEDQSYIIETLGVVLSAAA